MDAPAVDITLYQMDCVDRSAMTSMVATANQTPTAMLVAPDGTSMVLSTEADIPANWSLVLYIAGKGCVIMLPATEDPVK